MDDIGFMEASKNLKCSRCGSKAELLLRIHCVEKGLPLEALVPACKKCAKETGVIDKLNSVE